MKVQFMETTGESPGAFALLTPQLFICGEPREAPWGPKGAQTTSGEFVVLDFDLLECEAITSGEEFAFAGSVIDLRDLCAGADGALRVLCDKRFVVRPSRYGRESATEYLQACSPDSDEDFRHLSFLGKPIRVDEAHRDDMGGGWQYHRSCEAVDDEIAAKNGALHDDAIRARRRISAT